MKLSLSVLLLCVVGTVQGSFLRGDDAFTCPDYSAIVQPSVSAEVFNISELDGKWFLTATNEPTIPPICRCPRNTFTVDLDSATYKYTNTLVCDHIPTPEMNFNIDGKLSSDPSTPGNLAEHASFSPFKLKPNMVFHAPRNDADEIEYVFTYACIAKGVFSFNLMARTADVDEATVRKLIDDATTLTGGVMKVENMKITSPDTWQECGAALEL